MRLFILIGFLLVSSYGKTQSPADAALCFYEWYLHAIKSRDAGEHTAVVKKGANGETLLDYERYLHNLDSLGCIADTFKQSEIVRFQSCQDYFKDIPYVVYYDQVDNDAYTYDVPCPFFTQFYWIKDINYWAFVRVVESKIEGNNAEVQLELASGAARQNRRVFLKMIDQKWKIIKISQGL
ncbi:hypothetical protein [Haliscomenobacter sp.]|uniref:hypothetical protein n=1 Tax=Haliscomenobacter sp. TaxID=2717303 RepID=UPI0035930139